MVSLSPLPKVLLTISTWEQNIDPMVIRDEMFIAPWSLHDYVGFFAFNLKELGQLKGEEVCITLEDNIPIIRQPYNLSEVETYSPT